VKHAERLLRQEILRTHWPGLKGGLTSARLKGEGFHKVSKLRKIACTAHNPEPPMGATAERRSISQEAIILLEKALESIERPVNYRIQLLDQILKETREGHPQDITDPVGLISPDAIHEEAIALARKTIIQHMTQCI